MHTKTGINYVTELKNDANQNKRYYIDYILQVDKNTVFAGDANHG